jgi:hypothetical protein
MRRLIVIGLSFALAACGGESASSTPPVRTPPVTPEADVSTFGRIQSSILTPNCAVSGCHVSGSAAANGNLVLSADSAYANLVGALPANLTARANGLKRVLAGKPDSSLLVQKIVLALSYQSAVDYGNTMPVGSAPLTQGQIDYVRKWIEAGAPKTGNVADDALLANATPQAVPKFVPLAAPAVGTGYQLHVDSFAVKSNFERELFVYRPLQNPAPIYVNRIQTSMRSMSHFVLYANDKSTVPALFAPACVPPANTVRDIRNSDGSMNIANMLPMACHVFLGGAMTPTSDYRFPEGVALQMPASMSIDMNVHYVNRTTSEIPGEAYANLYVTPPAEVKKVAHSLNWSNEAISLPPRRSTTMERTFLVNERTTIFMLTSHMHMLGTQFDIRIVGGPRDGELVYTNTDWEHPQQLSFKEPIVLEKGQGLKSVITWNNYMDHTVSFGLQSTDEMGIIFGYYY